MYVCMYTHTCTGMWAYIYVHTCMCTCTYVCACIEVCTCACIHACVCACVWVRAHVCACLSARRLGAGPGRVAGRKHLSPPSSAANQRQRRPLVPPLCGPSANRGAGRVPALEVAARPGRAGRGMRAGSCGSLLRWCVRAPGCCGLGLALRDAWPRAPPALPGAGEGPRGAAEPAGSAPCSPGAGRERGALLWAPRARGISSPVPSGQAGWRSGATAAPSRETPSSPCPRATGNAAWP